MTLNQLQFIWRIFIKTMDNYKKSNIGKLNKIFTLLMITFPILALYATPFSGISVADLLLISIQPILIIHLFRINNKINKTIHFSILFYALYISIHFLITVLTVNNMEAMDIFLNTSRYIFYLITLAIYTKTFFHIKFAKTVLKHFTIFASIYLIIQFFLYSLYGYYLPGTIPFLDLQVNTINEIYSRYNQGYYIRVHSIFAEPSHFTIYVLPYLIICLSEVKYKLPEYIPAILISIAILMSQSSTGIIMAGVIWIIWYLYRIIDKGISKKKSIFIVLSILFIPVVLLFITRTNSFDFFIDRTFSSGSLGEAGYRRLGNGVILHEIFKNSSLYLLFGQGMVNLQTYIPGATRLFVYFGISGVVLLLAIFTKIYYSGNRIQKEILIIFVILNFGTEILFGNFIFLYLPFLLLHDQKSIERG